MAWKGSSGADAVPPLTVGVSLREHTTLAVGGMARWWADATTQAALREVLAYACQQRLRTCVLGGGSNVVVADAGFDGVVLRYADARIDARHEGDRVWLYAAAGVVWDDLVAMAVAEHWEGIECLSGIPGWVGAAPIQNIGAYGQEVGDCLHAVHVVERATGHAHVLPAAACGLGYRTSFFKGEWRERFVITGIELYLHQHQQHRQQHYQHQHQQHGEQGGHAPCSDGHRDLLPQRMRAATARHDELQRLLANRYGAHPPPLPAVRAAVLEIRRSKSMVYDPRDPNHRSAGSFFTNPVVEGAQVTHVQRVLQGLQQDSARLPIYAMPGGLYKLSAAWLIERAGFGRGFTLGEVGLSSNHTLALINRGGATAADVLQLAALIQRKVHGLFGIWLQPEPVFVGFTELEPLHRGDEA